VQTEHVQGDSLRKTVERPEPVGVSARTEKRRAGKRGKTRRKERPPEHNGGGSLVLARMAARRFCSRPYEQG